MIPIPHKQEMSKVDEAFDLLDEAWTVIPSVEQDLSSQTNQFLKNIELSGEQTRISKMTSSHLLIKGCAGSGKSITLLTRMIQKMSEEFGKRFLFVSYSQALVRDAERRFKQSDFYNELQEHRHDVSFLTFHELAQQLLYSIGHKLPVFKTTHRNLTREEDNIGAKIHLLLDKLETDEFKELPSIFTIKQTENTAFLLDEFSWMKGNGFITLEDYLECDRVGRGRLPSVSVKQRKTIFRLFEYYRELQQTNFYNRVDRDDYALLVMENLHRLLKSQMYDHIFIDEVQDLQPMQLRVLVALNKGTLSLSGDERQRIYKSSPFSYRQLGIKIQGSNVVLKENWRSTYQIMRLANSLKFARGKEDSKYDDEKFFPRQGDKPVIRAFKKYNDMLDGTADKILEIHQTDPKASFAILHRNNNPQTERGVKDYLRRHFKVKHYVDHKQDEHDGVKPNVYFLEAKATKGLEFDYVFVVDFNKTFYPHKDEISNLRTNGKNQKTEYMREDEKELKDKEKRILYVSLTRTRKAVFLYYSCKEHPEINISPFAKDFDIKDYYHYGFRKTLLG